MPPPTWDKHCFTWSLNSLNYLAQLTTTLGTFRFDKPGQNKVKILDGFVIFSLFAQMFTSYEGLRDSFVWREKDPSFVALNTRIPGTCCKRVLVDFAA